MTIQVKAIEQYFYVVLFISMLYKLVLTFESVDVKAIERYFQVVLFVDIDNFANRNSRFFHQF